MESNKEFLINKISSQYNKEDIDRIINGYNCKRVVSFRVNTLKSTVAKVSEVLRNEKIDFEKVSWSNEAFIIKNVNEKQIEELDIYKNGEIYLQSLSSMLPPIVLEPQKDEDILDMAAAPGGKTTQIAAITDNQAHITACEMNVVRAEKLRFNIEKQGASSVYVMQKDSRNIDDYFSFDRILLDAPCSGSGTLDLNKEDTFKYFSQKLVEKSMKAQLTLLKKALKILKPGKELVYSTCSILSCENEEIVIEALRGANAEIVPIKFDGIEELPLLPTKLEGTLCVCPNELYEGFYIAKIRKNTN
jgi:NOL1/NOP2/sun family putative RNA methylase